MAGDTGDESAGVEALEVLSKVAHQAVRRGVSEDIVDSLPLRRGKGGVVPRLRRPGGSWSWQVGGAHLCCHAAVRP